MPKLQVAETLLRAALVAFAAGGLCILVGVARGAFAPRRIALTYALEVVVLGAVMLPAYLGGAAFAAAVATIAASSAIELGRVVARAGARPARVLAACAYVGLGGLGLLGLGGGEAGFGHVVFCFSLVEINDSSAYLAGHLLGGRRPWPGLSPRKTLAGHLVGLALTCAVAPLFRFALPSLSGQQAALGGGLLALAAQAGDLVASRFKRDAGVKDFGSWIPTHGGLLDVYDSLLFAAPLFLAYLAWLERA